MPELSDASLEQRLAALSEIISAAARGSTQADGPLLLSYALWPDGVPEWIVSAFGKTCRWEGCTEPVPDGAPKAGPTANLCVEHREARSRLLSQERRKSNGDSGAGMVSEESSDQPDEPAHETPAPEGLWVLANRVDQAEKALAVARRNYREGLQAELEHLNDEVLVG